MSKSRSPSASGSKSPIGTPFRASAIIIVALVLFVGWYSIAANYDYGALAGTYHFRDNKIQCALQLQKEGTFQQTVEQGAKVTHVSGTWHRSGEAGVDFSVGFLPLPGARTYIEEFPGKGDGGPEDHAYYGHFEKVFGV